MEPQAPPQPDSNLIHFAKRLEYLPRYILDFFFGLLAAMISDVVTTSILLASVALGLAIGHWWLAVAFFFTLYAFLRIIGMLANAIGSTGVALARAQQAPPPSYPSMMMQPSAPAQGTVVNHAGDDIERIPVTLPASNG